MGAMKIYQAQWWNPFGWTQKFFMWFARGDALKQEEDHFDALKELTTDRLDAIQYLYDRLNIIDEKSQVILTLNTITISALTITFEVAKSKGASGGFQVFGHPNLATAMLSSSFAALFFAFAVSRLRFDHISKDHGQSNDESAYEDHFFKITVARQLMVSVARGFTAVAFILFAVMLVPRVLG
jgi:hypothetical protein